MKRTRFCALLLAMLFTFAAAPAMAAWVTNAAIEGLPAITNQPQGASIATPATKPAETDLKAARAARVRAALTDGSAQGVFVTASTVANYFADRAWTYETKQELPLFKVPKTTLSLDVSPDVVVMHPLRNAFAGSKPSELTVVKVFGPGTLSADFASYSPAYTAGGVDNKRFAVISTDAKTVMPALATIEAGCYIALCVHSGDIFNVGSGDIIDPAFIYTRAAPEPDPDPAPQPVKPLIPDNLLPEGVQQLGPDDIEIPATTATSGLSEVARATVEAVAGGTHLLLKDSVVDGILAWQAPAMDTAVKIKIPVFKATVSAVGNIGLVMFELGDLGSSALVGKKAGQILPAKAINTTPSDALFYRFVSSPAQLADGAFAILKSDRKTFMSADETIASGQTYYILLALKDGGDFDTNTTPRVISDPCFIGYASTPTPPDPDPVGPQPVTPEFDDDLLPSGVEKANPIYIPSSVNTSGLNDRAAATVAAVSGTHLELTSTVVSNILSFRGNSVNQSIAVKMPVFRAHVSAAGRTGIVMFRLPSSSLTGFRAGSVAAIKAVSTVASEALNYTFVSSPGLLGDGKFAILKSDKATFMGANELFQSDGVYYILFAVRDGGSFDMNTQSAVISDPTFVGLATGHSSSGGCSAGSFAPGALLLALPLLGVILRKRGK